MTNEINNFVIKNTTLNQIINLALNKKAHRLNVLDVRGLCSITDFFVICSGNSEPQIKAILNRQNFIEIPESEEFEFTIGKFKFNSKLRFLSLDDQIIKLSPKENQLLRLLVIHLNDLLPRQIALNKIWRDDNYFTSRSMDVYIAKLRKYLSKDSNIEIINIHGEGFRLLVKN